MHFKRKKTKTNDSRPDICCQHGYVSYYLSVVTPKKGKRRFYGANSMRRTRFLRPFWPSSWHMFPRSKNSQP